jgi:hypothetical protein
MFGFLFIIFKINMINKLNFKNENNLNKNYNDNFVEYNIKKYGYIIRK